jgi:hypothetical protein
MCCEQKLFHTWFHILPGFELYVIIKSRFCPIFGPMLVFSVHEAVIIRLTEF